MTWILSTGNLSKRISLTTTKKLPLFSTGNSSKQLAPAFTVNPQAQYSLTTRPDFQPIKLDLTLEPLTVTLYIFNALLDISGLNQVFNIQQLKKEAYFLDYTENKTYILTATQGVGLELLSRRQVKEEDFLRTETEMFYTFSETPAPQVIEVSSEGLIYTPETTSNSTHTFSFNQGKLILQISKTCSPQAGKSITITERESLLNSDQQYLGYSFDLKQESSQIDFIDALTYRGQTFQASSEIKENTLLFNRIEKECLCISKPL